MHILFVCWGNICRSPAAEATFKKLLKEESLENEISCDSAGTIGQHHGNPPDPRMQKAAKLRNLPIGGTARKVTDQDFHDADLLITMDHFNYSELRIVEVIHRNEKICIMKVLICYLACSPSNWEIS